MTFGKNNCSILPSDPQTQKYLLSHYRKSLPIPDLYYLTVTLYTLIAFTIHKLAYLILSISLNNKFLEGRDKDKLCDFYTVVYQAQNIAPKM